MVILIAAIHLNERFGPPDIVSSDTQAADKATEPRWARHLRNTRSAKAAFDAAARAQLASFTDTPEIQAEHLTAVSAAERAWNAAVNASNHDPADDE